MVARVAPEKRLSFGASSNPIFRQLTEAELLDRTLLALPLDAGCRTGGIVAEALIIFFDSLITRWVADRSTPLCAIGIRALTTRALATRSLGTTKSPRETFRCERDADLAGV